MGNQSGPLRSDARSFHSNGDDGAPIDRQHREPYTVDDDVLTALRDGTQTIEDQTGDRGVIPGRQLQPEIDQVMHRETAREHERSSSGCVATA